ncbi:MAG: 1-deoxy-D-xylulose-5-phosphate reductoisomerase [Gammaproteobacteria bacterium]|nr:MAG: 1-deoxy-D-xylulose-5-phosphate reductoisomerase [Gammaproteobacteria bacterium]
MSENDIKTVAILGSTGSIGISTLDVIDRHQDLFRVTALTANTQVDRLFEQCKKFRPKVAVMVDEKAARQLDDQLKAAGYSIKVETGQAGLEKVAGSSDSDIVMAAIVGAAGLSPTLEAVKAGKRVLFANKEPLVMCGDIFIEQARKSGATLLPIDSEHNAIFQCMPSNYHAGDKHRGIKRILLTGSGGPFREMDQSALLHVTPAQACNHPNWSMGKKISVDSATLMNKGLELIEACWLFNVTPDRIQIVIHPQSIIHSMVEYLDGSILAQMGNPDMRTPIAHALAWPERIDSGVDGLDFFKTNRLDFEEPDIERFPCLTYAYKSARAGGTAPTTLNAANEVAVQSFLNGEIGFLDIARVIGYVLEQIPHKAVSDVDTVLETDNKARKIATEYINTMSNSDRAGIA